MSPAYPLPVVSYEIRDACHVGLFMWMIGGAISSLLLRRTCTAGREYDAGLYAYWRSTKLLALCGVLFMAAAVTHPAFCEDERVSPEQILPEGNDLVALSFSSDPNLKTFNQALADQEQGKITDAIEGYRKILAHYPKCLPALYNLGLCFEKMEEWNASLKAFDSAAEINPYSESTYRHLIFVARKAGKNREGRVFYSHYLKL